MTNDRQPASSGNPLAGRETAAQPAQRSTVLGRHWPLLVVLILFAAMATAYSLVLPLGEVSDETSHYALVRFIAEEGRPPQTNAERQAISIKGDASPFYHGLVALLTQHVDVSPLPELPGALDRQERLVPSDGNQYERVFFHTEDEIFPFRGIALAWHLARLVSIGLGIATIVAVYLVGLTIFPNRRLFALAAAAFTALIPRFIVQSAVINDDNLATPLVTFAVYFLIRAAQGDYRRRQLLPLGLFMGLAALAKYHALVLVVEVVLVFGFLAWRERWPVRRLLSRWGWVAASFVLVSGWWFAYVVLRFNQVAELGLVQGLLAPLGDPVVAEGFASAAALEPLGTAGNVEQVLTFPGWVWHVFRTFWIVYGFRGFAMAPTWVYLVFAGLSLVALAGFARLFWDSRRLWLPARLSPAPAGSGPATETTARPRLRAAAVLGLHLIVYLCLIYARHVFEPDKTTAQGRHLYPAIVSLAIFFTWGLFTSLDWLTARLGRRDDARRLTTGLTLLLVVLVLLPASLVTPSAFFLPHFLPYMPLSSAGAGHAAMTNRLSVNFGQGLDLVGYDLGDDRPQAGGVLPLTLFWETGAKPEREEIFQVCLSDRAGARVTCRLSYPADGRYPMRAWERGYLLRDQVYLPLPDCIPAGDYQLDLTLLPLAASQAGTTVDAALTQQPAEERQAVVLADVAVTAGGDGSTNGATPPSRAELWVGAQKLTGGQISLDQLRQALTVLVTVPGAGAETPPQPYFAPLSRMGEGTGGVGQWSPVTVTGQVAPVYACPNGTLAAGYSFFVDAAVAPGAYRLLMDGGTGDTIQVSVDTRPRHFEAPAQIANEIEANFSGQVTLLGYDIDLSPKLPGETIPFTGYWRAETLTKYALIEALYLLTGDTMDIQGRSEWALGGHYPNLLWAPGEYVTETRAIQIESQAPPGMYTIQLSLYGFMTFENGEISAPIYVPLTTPEAQEPIEKLFLGTVRILDPAHFQPAQFPVEARLGESIRLDGYDLAGDRFRPGDNLSPALHWQAVQPPDADYTVFSQLVGPDGVVWAQHDSPPQSGRFATGLWQPGDPVVDRHLLELPADMPPGAYRLLVGMYEPSTGARLAASAANGTPWADDAVLLTTITVE